jgi:preprotein translocase subunit SecA
MLSVIDQHWREHLYEMDYLQEGINLRAMGQKDPLAEWQREGFDMFEAMMGTTDEEFVRYVFHVQVMVDEAPNADVRNVQYSAPEDPVAGTTSIRDAAVAELEAGEIDNEAARAAAMEASVPDAPQQPVRVEKTPGRNEPCWCGSGKKYKLCHGK